MKTMRFASFLFLISVLCSQGYSQTLEDLKVTDKRYQSCLDQGKNMINCSRFYSTELNNLLIKTYNTLNENINEADRCTLETDQQEWLEKKDIYFEKVEKEYAADINNDSRMIAIDRRATFVRERIEELLDKLGTVE